MCGGECGITDISGIKKLPNLKNLDLKCNRLRDISPLYKLTNLTNIDLSDNQSKRKIIYTFA